MGDKHGNGRYFLYQAIDNLDLTHSWMSEPSDIAKLDKIISDVRKMRNKLPKSKDI